MKKVVTPGGSGSALSFREKENQCQSVFNSCLATGAGFYHLCTPGEGQQIIFETDLDFETGMLAAAICLHDSPNVRILTFEWMSNHVHLILLGINEEIRAFFLLLKTRLKRMLKQRGRIVDLSGFTPKLIAVDSLESLRNQIVYVNRNNYLVDPRYTPFSYPYGANGCYFSGSPVAFGERRYDELSFREKRELLHSHNLDYPGEYRVRGHYFSPASFCDIALGESLFRDARHYFHKISRDVESYREVAAVVGDSIYYTDDELVSLVYGICMKEYGNAKPTLLPIAEKQKLARKLHFDYNASNEQIGRILKIHISVLESMFINK